MMGFDTTQLEIVIAKDCDVLSRAAGVILQVKEEGNLLLCTFLLGNVAVDKILRIMMADITNGTVRFLMSTGLVRVYIL